MEIRTSHQVVFSANLRLPHSEDADTAMKQRLLAMEY